MVQVFIPGFEMGFSLDDNERGSIALFRGKVVD
jgi:hypothetical protein